VHTDIDDVGPVFAEAARVLRPGGSFVYVGTHPCFVGYFVERRDDQTYVLHPGYGDARWHDTSPYFGPGLRSRVGERHVPLAELVNHLLATGLRLVHMVEPGPEAGLPWLLALTAEKRA
jgi:hypothetical protein